MPQRPKMNERQTIYTLLVGLRGKATKHSSLEILYKLFRKIRYTKGYNITIREIKKAVNSYKYANRL